MDLSSDWTIHTAPSPDKWECEKKGRVASSPVNSHHEYESSSTQPKKKPRNYANVRPSIDIALSTAITRI